jgi:phospholipid-transporting ATPase
VIFVVTFKLSSHTKFWSVLLFISILFLSLGLYVAYMWISNFYLVDYTWVSNTASTYFTTGQTYFILLFGVCLVLFIDGLVLSVDFERGGYSSRMRNLIKSEQEHAKERYREFSIRSSEINTNQAKNEASH